LPRRRPGPLRFALPPRGRCLVELHALSWDCILLSSSVRRLCRLPLLRRGNLRGSHDRHGRSLLRPDFGIGCRRLETDDQLSYQDLCRRLLCVWSLPLLRRRRRDDRRRLDSGRLLRADVEFGGRNMGVDNAVPNRGRRHELRHLERINLLRGRGGEYAGPGPYERGVLRLNLLVGRPGQLVGHDCLSWEHSARCMRRGGRRFDLLHWRFYHDRR
jgi:hypothetical protein